MMQATDKGVETGTDTSPASANQDNKVNALNRSGDLKESDARITSTQPSQSPPSEMAEDNFVRLAKVLISDKKMSERDVIEKIKSDAVEEFFTRYPQSKWEGFSVENRIVLENAVRLAFKHKDDEWFDKIVYHPEAKDCAIDECWICAIRDCPHHEPLHYHHDGCPACYGDNEADK